MKPGELLQWCKEGLKAGASLGDGGTLFFPFLGCGSTFILCGNGILLRSSEGARLGILF